MLKVSLLQTPCVELDGQIMAFPYRRAEALLYYMLVQHSATRQELIALLWESFDEATGLKNLRNTLYTLKKLLGSEFLLSPQKSLIVVNSSCEYTCDYDLFVREGDLSAYGGPFLQGFSVKNAFTYEEWLSRTRDKLRDQYLRQMSRRARDALARGDAAQAAQWAEEYLREEPLNEQMCVFLMTLWRQARQYARAAQVYQELKARLREDLGTDPMESTTLFYYETMNEWNDSSQSNPKKSTVPVGRETAYAALCSAAELFHQGSSRRCSQLLTGEAGSGKSELVDQLLHCTDLTEFLVIRCTCLQSEQQTPLALWYRILLPVTDFIQTGGLSVPASAWTRLRQAFLLFQEAGAPADTPPPRMLHQPDSPLEDSLLLAFSSVLRRRRIVLILEELQWIDPDSLRLTDALLRHVEVGGVLAILTCRSNCGSGPRKVLEQAVSNGLVQKHVLSPLSRDETGRLLRSELGDSAAASLEEQFHLKTGGNLLLLTELIRAYRRSGSIDKTLGTLDDILMERMNGMSENTNHIAELLSVFPEDAPCRILLKLVDGDDRSLTDGLDELLGRGLIEEQHTGSDISYLFSHQRIRELVYERMTFFQRQPLHLRIAQLLTEGEAPLRSNECRQAARHFRLAKDTLHALEYQIRALELESARSCEPFPLLPSEEVPCVPADRLEEETRQVLQELSSLQAPAQAKQRLERTLTLIRGRVALFRGNFSEGSALLGSLSAGSGDPDYDEMIRACYLLASSALFLQAADQAERYTTAGMRLLQRRDVCALTAQFQRLHSNCFCLRGAYHKSSYYIQEAIRELEKLPQTRINQVQTAAAVYDWGRLCRQQQDYAGASAQFNRALAVMTDDSPWPGTVWICVHYGRMAFALDDHMKARKMFELGYTLSQATGELWGRTAAAAFIAYYQGQDEDYESAAATLQDAQSCQRRLASPLEGAILCFVSMKLRLRLNHSHRLDTPLEPLLPQSSDSYARQGIRLLSGVPDVFEAQQLARNLRDGLSAKQTYRASELYSKNKHFMTE